MAPMPKQPGDPSGSAALSPLILLLIAGFVYLAFYPLLPPAPVPATAPPGEFSAARAAAHLEKTARAPHPTGSAENAGVRAYIVGQMAALDLAPEVQTTAAVRSVAGLINAATVSNVIGRMAGRGNSRALMLVTHYDSVPNGPGASDDGAGIATLLETARALKAGPPLKNDVIFLFTDGEELGLQGAQAFMNGHPWAKDASVVLNFEARGSGGASFLFETGPRNGWLVRQFASACPYPAGYSFLYEFYRRMPNQTDFSVFKRGALTGLNFAYADGWVHYHTMKDNLENIDLRSLQHHGSYAIALARRLGNLDLTEPADGDVVYFSLFGWTLCYSQGWTIPLSAAVTLLFVWVLRMGIKSGRLTWRGIVVGCAGWLGATLMAAIIASGVWRMIAQTSLASLTQFGIGYNSGFYAAAFLVLTAAFVAGAGTALREVTAGENLVAGVLIWWWLAAVITGFFFPGASYLFAWPLAFASAGLGYGMKCGASPSTWAGALIWLVPALVGILLCVPLVYALFLLLSTANLVPLALATALLVGLLLPLIHALAGTSGRRVTLSLSLVALGFFAGGTATRGYDADNPATDMLFYWLDADSGQAEWISTDAAPDAWTHPFLGQNPAKGNLKDLLGLDRPILRTPAIPLREVEPGLALLDATSDHQATWIAVLISAPRQARALWLEVRGAEVLEARFSGKKVAGQTRNGSTRIYYVGIPEGGLMLELRLPSTANPDLRVVAQCDGLPTLPGISYEPRPEALMPAPWPPFDSSTLIAKTYHNLAVSVPTQRRRDRN
jgi:hypothetical protein